MFPRWSWKMLTIQNQTQFDHQQSLIDQNTVVVQPGGRIPNEGTPVPSSQPQAHPRTALSTGVIVGIVVGGLALLALAAALFFFIGRAKTLQEFLQRQGATTHGQASQDMVYSPGFEGCVPIRREQPPPSYLSYRTSTKEGVIDPAHRSGFEGEHLRSSTASPGSEMWRISLYDGPPQEMDAQSGAPGR